MKRTWSIKFLVLFLTIQMAFLSDPSVQLYADAAGTEAPSEQYVLAQADPFSDLSAETVDPFSDPSAETVDPFSDPSADTMDPFA